MPLGIFAGSRVAIFAVLFFATRLPGAGTAPRFLTAWDGGWYLLIARKGYPKSLVPAPGQSDHAFFPVYPLLIRGLHAVAGGSLDRAAVVVTIAASAAAMVVIWRLVERLTDTPTATRSIAFMSFFPWAFIFSFAYSEGLLLLLAGICLLALLDERWMIAFMSFFPWAFIFSFAYSEGLLLLLAGICLLALLDERWLTAGIAAALAGAARPNGFVLALPCAWAAIGAIRRTRDWWALAAPVLAPVGVLGFFGYLQLRTGDFLANLHARSRGWAYDGIGFFHRPTPGRVLSSFLAHPFLDLDKLVSFLSIAFIVVALGLMLWWRPPAVVWLYVLPVVVLAIWFDTYVSMARFALTAFPLLVAVARPVKGPAFYVLLGVSAALMATLFIFIGSTLLLTP